MQDLTPVGLSKDGRKLVLVSSSGEEYAVPVDHRLRTALRGDNARLGQLEMKMESALRPRDIQTRIRAGDSAESVAAAAQTSVEAIMPFAAPVLAERAHVAQSALSASVRRKQSEAPASHRTLADAANSHFSGIGLHADDVEWDAWRRDDGRWSLVADYTSSGAPIQAQFTYDVRGKFVMADNDEARMLTGELAAPTTKAPRAGATGRRLTAVPADDELPLGDDAIELVRETPEAEEKPVADHAAADWIAAGPVDAADDEAGDEGGDEQVEDPAAEVDEPVGETPSEPPSDTRPRKKGRSQVPSWDEIMFGGGKSD